MTTRPMLQFGKTVSGVGLALVVALTIGLGGIQAEQTDADNYFDRFPIPAGERTEVDEFDAYAPIDLGPSVVTDGGSLRRAGLTINGVEVGASADDPCSPARCEAW